MIWQQENGGGTVYSFPNIQTFICKLHLKWIPHIFNRIASNYQTATRRALPPLSISIWLIVNGILISVYLKLILDFTLVFFSYTSGGFEFALHCNYKWTDKPNALVTFRNFLQDILCHVLLFLKPCSFYASNSLSSNN